MPLLQLYKESTGSCSIKTCIKCTVTVLKQSVETKVDYYVT